MKKTIKDLHLNYKNFWIKDRLFSLIGGIFFLIIAFFIQNIANNYVVETGGTAVGDILLNNIPALNVDSFIIISTLTFSLLMVVLVIIKPQYMIFTLKTLSLFIIVRSFFISLTHLGISPHQIVFDKNIIGFGLYDIIFNSKNDFFFSGHTGLPFLMALIFHNIKLWRNFCFVISFIFGISVIVGHIHYSIDVFAAPFITYSIYSIAKVLFKKDYKLIK